ncbi:MAG TPA: AMP-binding protein [Gammaproteobacteria bacterium]
MAARASSPSPAQARRDEPDDADIGFLRFAARDPHEVAVVDPTGRPWSRGELGALVARLARAFRAAGLAPRETIAIAAPNCAEYLAAYLAGVYAGLFVVPVNWHLAPNETEHILTDSGARAVVVHERLGEHKLASLVSCNERVELRLCIGRAAGFVPLDAFVAPYSSAALEASPTGRMMAYTSATTGRPKAVRLPPRDGHRALVRITAGNRFLGILPEDGNVHLCASMLYHPAPLVGCEMALHMGHPVVLVDVWDSEPLLQLIERYGVTTTFMVPAMFVRLLKLREAVRRRYRVASLRAVVHGGAPCPPEIKRAMIEWWGPVVWEAYGATETPGTVVSAVEWLRRPGTVGRPYPGGAEAVKIMDESGRELPPGEVGLVYLRPRSGERFEYLGDPEKTRACYRGDFVTVGDLGYLDEEGYLFLCDRRTDVIISSGMNIYPAEIEMALVQHPLVRDCAVLGEPHALLGEVPKAYVQLEAGAAGGPAMTAELLRFLGERLAAMKLPKRFEYVERVPRDPNGKLYRRLLRKPRDGSVAP